MKLDDFVSETLKQIIKGVVSAQEYGNTQNAKVNPNSARFHSNTEGHAFCSDTGVPLQKVEFDVAVTVTEEQTTASDGESVGSISVTSASSNISQNSSISRIRFEVPVLLPTVGKQEEW
ncbi:hypothetical protein LCGC14_0209850 [marine sediment metagenome]|uniref:Uncharacterized protein n=1 Tax=marine sediment metagenome TaxID=412755 RepID=A0A0F9UXE1_9ZZZZ|nr:hypothetical protein [Halomonas sp.]HDZ48228.1 hypothetical protein [Halomonas sp.]HEB03494.1 hypothetical protein [Halomonas sp.]